MIILSTVKRSEINTFSFYFPISVSRWLGSFGLVAVFRLDSIEIFFLSGGFSFSCRLCLGLSFLFL